MKKQLVIYFSLVLFTGIVQAGITPVNLTCENLHNPAVVDILKPRLSWINIAPEDERGQTQTAWRAAMNIMPWEYYLHYGDIDLLRNNYEGYFRYSVLL